MFSDKQGCKGPGQVQDLDSELDYGLDNRLDYGPDYVYTTDFRTEFWTDVGVWNHRTGLPDSNFNAIQFNKIHLTVELYTALPWHTKLLQFSGLELF